MIDPTEPASAGPSWAKALALGAALAFLGAAIGIFVSRDRPPGEGSVDVGFYQDMLTHHDQALELSALELANGQDQTARAFAQEILIFQSYENGLMDGALRDWGYSRQDRSDQAMGWMGMPVPVAEMAGTIGEDEVDRMRSARGRAADELFLDLMAEHHRGGVHMAEYAAREAEDDDVRDLARRMARNQAIEINEYRQTAERKGFDIEIEPAEVPESTA